MSVGPALPWTSRLWPTRQPSPTSLSWPGPGVRGDVIPATHLNSLRLGGARWTLESAHPAGLAQRSTGGARSARMGRRSAVVAARGPARGPLARSVAGGPVGVGCTRSQRSCCSVRHNSSVGFRNESAEQAVLLAHAYRSVSGTCAPAVWPAAGVLPQGRHHHRRDRRAERPRAPARGLYRPCPPTSTHSPRLSGSHGSELLVEASLADATRPARSPALSACRWAGRLASVRRWRLPEPDSEPFPTWLRGGQVGAAALLRKR